MDEAGPAEGVGSRSEDRRLGRSARPETQMTRLTGTRTQQSPSHGDPPPAPGSPCFALLPERKVKYTVRKSPSGEIFGA